MVENTVKAIIYKNFTGGIGSDKYFPLENGCYDGEGLDIRRGGRVILGTHNTNNITTFTGSTISTLGYDMYAATNGKIFSPDNILLYQFESYGVINNYIDQTIGGTSHRLFFAGNRISRYTGNIYDNITLSMSPTTVTRGYVGNVFVHNTGNTTPLVNSANAVAGKRYRISIVVTNITGGSISIDVGNSGTPYTISANGSYIFFLTAVNTTPFSITPTSTFDGHFTDVNLLGLCTMEEGYYNMVGGVGSTICPLLESNVTVYIGNGNDVRTINPLGTLTKALSLKKSTTIIAITKIEEQFIIRTRDGQGGIVYYRDGISEAPSRSIYWYNEQIQNVINTGNGHIVLTGGDFGIKKIWKSDGLNKVMLYQTREGTRYSVASNSLIPPIPLYFNGSANNFLVNNVESFGDLVFLPGYNKIIVFGHRIPGFKDALFCDFAYKEPQIRAMYAYNGELCVAYLVGSDTKVIKRKLDNYESLKDSTTSYYFGNRGYLSLNPIVIQPIKQKHLKQIKIGYKTPTNTFMNLYYALDRETDRYTFVVDELINNVTIDPVIGDIYGIGTARYTVTKVTKFLSYMFIETQETVAYYTPRQGATLTKISGTGDSTITYVDFHNYRYFDIITSTTELKSRERTRILDNVCDEVQFRIELLTRDGKYTPEFNDLTLFFDEINDQ